MPRNLTQEKLEYFYRYSLAIKICNTQQFQEIRKTSASLAFYLFLSLHLGCHSEAFLFYESKFQTNTHKTTPNMTIKYNKFQYIYSQLGLAVNQSHLLPPKNNQLAKFKTQLIQLVSVWNQRMKEKAQAVHFDCALFSLCPLKGQTFPD